MKKTLWTGVVTIAIALMGIAPQAVAEAGDSISFNLQLASGVTCVASAAHARVTVSDLGPVQNMHIEVTGLTPNTSFTTFITQHGNRPFGFSWYQGELQTNTRGNGVADYTGIFSSETFLLTDSNTPVQLDHIGIWFADPNDAARAGCAAIVTPFDGDHNAGILVFSSANFADDQGPLLQLREDEPATRQ